jgi:hypothetical protein
MYLRKEKETAIIGQMAINFDNKTIQLYFTEQGEKFTPFHLKKAIKEIAKHPIVEHFAIANIHINKKIIPKNTIIIYKHIITKKRKYFYSLIHLQNYQNILE